jgi:hypothetical protein
MSQRPPAITLTPYEFWTYVRNNIDCDEVLDRLDNQHNLISHFLYFSSLGRTIDELDDILKKKKKEVGHVFKELTQLPDFRRLTEPFVRRKHRPHPYRRSPVASRSSPCNAASNNNTSPNNESPQTIPILSLPPSPVLFGYLPLSPIDVDSLLSSTSTSLHNCTHTPSYMTNDSRILVWNCTSHLS